MNTMSNLEREQSDQQCEDTPQAHSAEASFDEVSTHVTTMSTIRLGTLRGVVGEWRFDPVPEGALVVIVPATMRKPVPWKLERMAARANKDGLLMQLNPDDPSSREGDDALILPVPERYRVYWTLDEERYAEALKEPPWLEGQSTLIQLKRYRAPEKQLFKQLDDLDHGDAFYKRQDTRSVIRNHILERHTFYEESGVPYEGTYDRDAVPFFDVTPRPIRALFLVEAMLWYAMCANDAAAKDIATMQYVCAIAEAADKGLTNPGLEPEVPKLFPTEADRRMFECYREYVWRCAATSMSQDLVEQSINVTTGSTENPGGVPKPGPDGVHGLPIDEPWYRAASDVLRASTGKHNGPATHPFFRGFTGLVREQIKEGRPLTSAQQDFILRYYEGYRFGAAMRGVYADDAAAFKKSPAGRDYRTRVAARIADWSKTGDQLMQLCADILGKHVGAEIYQAWSECYRDDEELLARYVDASAHCSYRWWEAVTKLEGELVEGHWPFWKTFKARVKPSYEISKGASKLCKLLAERVAAYKLAVLEANKMLGTVGRLELALTGKDIDPVKHIVKTEKAEVRLVPTADGGELKVSLSSVARKDKPGMQRTVKLRLLRQASSQSGSGKAFQYDGHIKLTPVQAELPAHLDDMADAARFSSAWGALAELINIAIGMNIFFGEHAKGKDQFFAAFDIAKGMVGLVKSFPAAVVSLLPDVGTWDPFDKLTTERIKVASDVFSFVDGLFKIYKGLDLLYSDEADVKYERAMNRPFRADMQHYANVANMVVGLASAGDLVAQVCAESLIAGFTGTTFGMLLGVGGAVIAAAAAFAVDLSQEWSEEYQRIELAWAKACKSQVHGTQFKVSADLVALMKIADASMSAA